jgi:hypothetical protein
MLILVKSFDGNIDNIKYREFSLPGYKTLQSSESQLMLLRNISPPSSGLKSRLSKKPA